MKKYYCCSLMSIAVPIIIILSMYWLNHQLGLIVADSLALNQCSPSEIQAMADFTLPESATNLHSTCGGLQGQSAEARFEMNPDDLDTFIASTRLTEPLSSTAPLPKPDNFLFYSKKPESYLYGKYEEWEISQQVLIDTSDPDRYIVYILLLRG